MVWQPYHKINLIDEGLATYEQIELVNELVLRRGTRHFLTGGTVSSREVEENYRYPIRLADGELVTKFLPWLQKLYVNQLLDWSSEVFKKQLYPAIDIRSSININCLQGLGARYEWHVDTNPATGVLYCTTTNNETGGELIFSREGKECVVYTVVGDFLAFDARQIPHRVAPLKVDSDRISVPMNFYTSQEDQYRPSDLDSYLYEKRPQETKHEG